MTRTRMQQIMIATLLGLICWSPAAHGEKMLPISNGSKVTFDYTLTLADKTLVDSTVGKDPFIYIHGEHQINPVALEMALTGLKAGDKKRVTLPAAQAYGSYDENKRVKVPIRYVPPETKVGSLLRSQEGLEARVLEVTADSVVLDTNHPLAGKSLVFDVHILDVERPALGK
jgi:FKBP-type peptidyl-prolyl cis-trans isomerase SlyD